MATTPRVRALDWRGRGADVDGLLAHVDQLQSGEVRMSAPVLAKLPSPSQARLRISFSMRHVPQTIDASLLHGCGWNDDSFSTLAAVLPTLVCCSALVHLNVADNQIGDGGMTALADSLGVCISGGTAC